VLRATVASSDGRVLGESISTFLDLLTRPEFLLGISLGILGLISLAVRSRFTTPQNGWAIVLAGLVLLGVDMEDGWQSELMVGVGLMGIGGWLKTGSNSAHRYQFGLLAWPFVILGAGVVALRATELANERLFPATVVAAIVIGWSLSKWEDQPARNALGPLFTISAFGIWTTVPETDLARLLLGVSVPLAATTIPLLGARVTGAGGFMLGGVLAWIAVSGGEARSGSIIGAWACIGIIALLPIATRLRPGRTIAMWQVFSLHIVAVVIAARVFGLWDRALFAAIGSTILATLLLLVILLIRKQPPIESQLVP